MAKAGAEAQSKRREVSVERFERFWPGGFFGILHCVQDDGRDLQVPVQVQVQRQRQQQQQTATATATATANANATATQRQMQMQRQRQRLMQQQMQRQMRGFLASLRMKNVWISREEGRGNDEDNVGATTITTSKEPQEQRQSYGKNNVKAMARTTSKRG
jgi:hypothetical protein